MMSKKPMMGKVKVVEDDDESDDSVDSSMFGSMPDLDPEVLPSGWKQYVNHGNESVYDLLSGTCRFNIPAASVKKTEMELIFQKKDAEIILENLGFGFEAGNAMPERFIKAEQAKAGKKFHITDLDGHFNLALYECKIPERYLQGNMAIRLTPA